jgi:hypothetical protein
MSKANKKQRHKAKRNAKKLATRRQNSISPIKRLADARGELECWKSGDFESPGQISFFVYKRSAGLSGVACFLVDRGVVGLKDAFIKLQVDREEMEYMLSRGKSQGINPARCTVEEVRRTVAGGIRFAHDNGMRLPKDWVKVASIIGGVGDWATADVSAFSREFMGHPEDLRRRLIGEPFEDYIQRKDIAFLFADNAPVMNLDTGEYEDTGGDDFDDDEELDEEFDEDDIPEEMLDDIAKQLQPVAESLAEKTSQWAVSRNQIPATDLVRAWEGVVTALMLAKAAHPGGTDKQVQDFGAQLLRNMADELEVSERKAFELSIDQAMAHLVTDPAVMQDAMQNHRLGDPRLEE